MKARDIIDSVTPERACVQCEIEHGIYDKSDPNKSHGSCRRHLEQWAREQGLTDAQVDEIMRETKSYPPDLGPVREALERACSQCEKDHGIRSHGKSHGLCKRHTIEWAREGGVSEPEIEAIVREVDAGSGFPEDLGPVKKDEDLEKQCLYCGRLFDPQSNQWVDAKPRDPNNVSHGYCPDCLEKSKQQVRSMFGTERR